jgi:MoaA/NifB/PqqE/SkfB family radical SAM enzyme
MGRSIMTETTTPASRLKDDQLSGTDIKLDFTRMLNGSLSTFFRTFLKAAITDPAQASFFAKTIRWQRRAAKRRGALAKEGLHVPPIMIFSVTNLCNLNCKGCYHRSLRGSARPELSDERLQGVIAEARDLGISFIVLGGGEPLMKRAAIDITKKYPDVLFLVFTNGLLITPEAIGRMKSQRNLIPLVSLEGYGAETDGRRGTGVYGRLEGIIGEMNAAGLFWGVSLTLTRDNFDTVTDESYIKNLAAKGCKLFMLVEYTPIREGTEGWVLTDEQRSRLGAIGRSLRSKVKAVFVLLPGDEEEMGGCLSAGRGFIHVSAEGDIEPCPFIPYSDVNLNETSLRDALQSRFLRKIRLSHAELHETSGGCALWGKREWLTTAVQESRKEGGKKSS